MRARKRRSNSIFFSSSASPLWKRAEITELKLKKHWRSELYATIISVENWRLFELVCGGSGMNVVDGFELSMRVVDSIGFVYF